MAVLRETGAARDSALLHRACRAGAGGVDLGFHLGFGGVVTFPKSDAVREAARIAPDDRLLVETDCPYLAPVPFRGKRNEPSYSSAYGEKAGGSARR